VRVQYLEQHNLKPQKFYLDNEQAILKGTQSGKLLNLTGDRAVLDTITEKAEDFIANILLHTGGPARPTFDFQSEHHPWVAAAFKDIKISDPVRDEGKVVVSTMVPNISVMRIYVPSSFAPLDRVIY
jgi:hypothetical protein